MRGLLDRLDPRYAKICLYAAVTTLITIAAAMLLYYSTGFFTKLWMLICAVLEPTVFGALIAYLLNPAVVGVSHGLKRMGWRRQDYRSRRVIGVLVCLLCVAIVLLGILLVMAVVITRSLNAINFGFLETIYNEASLEVTELYDTIAGWAQSMGLVKAASETTEGGPALGTVVAGTFKSVASGASTALFSVIFSIYILIDGNRVGGYFLRVLRALVGEEMCGRIMVMVGDADRVFSGYIRGQFMDALVVGVLASIALTLGGVPHGAVVGILCGLGNLIPYVGAPLGIVTTILVCVVGGQYDKILVGVALLALIMFVDSNLINPRLLSQNIEVHPLLVVAALIAGSAVGGLAGMLVAVPAAAFVKIQIDRWLVERETKRSEDDSGHRTPSLGE